MAPKGHVLESAEMAPKDHVLESSEMAPKGHVLESLEMAPKDHQQLQNLLVKLGLLGVQTRSCVQWSGFSTWSMSLLYDVSRGFVSGWSR